MNGRTPSFFRLFRRSHYVRPVAWDDPSAEAEAARKDRERFAVAALAFCLKHDPAFLRHFWQGICRVPETDPDIMPPFAADGVLLEPPEWADLRLVSESKTGRYVWVIEVKAGAGLEERQRPDKPHEFENPNSGYGALCRGRGPCGYPLTVHRAWCKGKAGFELPQQASWNLCSTTLLGRRFGELSPQPFSARFVRDIW